MREDHDDLHGNPAVKQALQSARERMEQDWNEALEQLCSAARRPLVPGERVGPDGRRTYTPPLPGSVEARLFELEQRVERLTLSIDNDRAAIRREGYLMALSELKFKRPENPTAQSIDELIDKLAAEIGLLHGKKCSR